VDEQRVRGQAAIDRGYADQYSYEAEKAERRKDELGAVPIDPVRTPDRPLSALTAAKL